MSRFGEDDGSWEEQFSSFEAAIALYEHNLDAAIRGARGQKMLQALEAALVALPAPRLIAGVLATQEGEVCAIGALARAKGLLPADLPTNEQARDSDADFTSETVDIGKKCGMTQTLAWRVGQLNDDDFGSLTPERRYEAVLGWVRENSPNADFTTATEELADRG